jgi:hypothetical protein
MHPEQDVSRIVRSWLRVDEHESADQVLAIVLNSLDATPQRRHWWPARRTLDMNSYAKLAIAAVAVVAVAIVGFNLLPAGSGPGVGGPAATASPTAAPSAKPSPVASTSAQAASWPTGPLELRRYDVTANEVPLSFAIPATGWRGHPVGDALETGTFPADTYAWIVFPGDITAVATDPCSGQAAGVEGDSIDDLATALTTIPGTSAAEPVDTTVGGLPAKLVVLTIDADPPCAMNEFWLYGQTSLYPNSENSTIRIWVTEVAGERYVIHTDQAGANPRVEPEIQQVVDSIQFE